MKRLTLYLAIALAAIVLTACPGKEKPSPDPIPPPVATIPEPPPPEVTYDPGEVVDLGLCKRWETGPPAHRCYRVFSNGELYPDTCPEDLQTIPDCPRGSYVKPTTTSHSLRSRLIERHKLAAQHLNE